MEIALSLISIVVLIEQLQCSTVERTTTVFLEDEVFWKGTLRRRLEFSSVHSDFVDCSVDGARCLEKSDRSVRLLLKSRTGHGGAVNCTDVQWSATDCSTRMFEDCIDMAGAHWYGGTVVKQMLWPVELWNARMQPYVPGDALATPSGYGSAQERYWFNSAGLAIYVDWQLPLWVSVNSSRDGQLCLRAQYDDSPYDNLDDELLQLRYTVCQAPDARQIHDYTLSSGWFEKPSGIPDEKLFRYPIWSTWAQYKADIDAVKVLEFADAIVNNGFQNSQLEIDDRWETHYGDLEFDPVKFPDPRATVDALAQHGFRTTLWVHPFANLDSTAIVPGATRRAFVAVRGGTIPALTSWWVAGGNMAMTVDFTVQRGTNWFSERLRSLQSTYNISSFKFDAGETNWLPNCFRLGTPDRNPATYSAKYAEMAYNMDSQIRHQEVRVGAQTQRLPVFVRMLDKDSRWGYNNGIETIISHAINFGLIGYPFVLPDMVGGNAYGPLPDRELFIRWTELNVFLPSVQYSIAPWQFDDEVVEICRNMSALHESYAQLFIDMAREATFSGAPIIRPLWWIAPNDPVALVIDSEFLVGDNLLVAPVVKQGATARDVYLPGGTWRDELRGGEHSSVDGLWLTGYRVELAELAYFTWVAGQAAG